MRHRTRVGSRPAESKSKSSLHLSLGFLILSALLIGGAAILLRPQSTEDTGGIHSLWQQAITMGARTLGVRSRRHQPPVIYPYSIVPGGIHSVEDLRRAIASDPVVAAQYAKFNVAQFRIVKLRHDRYAYVSFRMGSEVFWTKKQLRLPRGETLITDGEHFARTRCGNQLSQVFHANTWSSEPSPAVLDTPVGPAPQTDEFAATVPDLTTFPVDGVLHAPADVPTLVSGIASVIPVPLAVSPSQNVLTPICLTTGTCPRSFRPKLTHPPSPVPEDSNFVLLLTGLAVLVIYQFSFARNSSRVPEGQHWS